MEKPAWKQRCMVEKKVEKKVSGKMDQPSTVCWTSGEIYSDLETRILQRVLQVPADLDLAA